MTIYICLCRCSEVPSYDGHEAYQVVISNATMMSSLMTKAVKEIETIFKNSVSNKTRDMIMMEAPTGIDD